MDVVDGNALKKGVRQTENSKKGWSSIVITKITKASINPTLSNTPPSGHRHAGSLNNTLKIRASSKRSQISNATNCPQNHRQNVENDKNHKTYPAATSQQRINCKIHSQSRYQITNITKLPFILQPAHHSFTATH